MDVSRGSWIYHQWNLLFYSYLFLSFLKLSKFETLQAFKPPKILPYKCIMKTKRKHFVLFH